MTDTDELLAIERALTDAEMHQFLADVKDRWPRLDGAKVADVLEHTTSYDMFLDKTEPFFEGHGPELPDGAPVTAVLHLLIILGRELTPLNVAKELLRAGLMPKPARKLAWHAYSTPPMRAVTGYQATGEDLHYLVFAHPQGVPADPVPAQWSAHRGHHQRRVLRRRDGHPGRRPPVRRTVRSRR